MTKESTLQWQKGINSPMTERNQPTNEWKEPTFQWMKGTNPPMNERNQPSNEWKKSTLQWKKDINPLMNEKNHPPMDENNNPLIRNQPSFYLFKKNLIEWTPRLYTNLSNSIVRTPLWGLYCEDSIVRIHCEDSLVTTPWRQLFDSIEMTPLKRLLWDDSIETTPLKRLHWDDSI